MFGINAFSQAPFSSLGANAFAVSVEESVRGSETLTCVGLFPAAYIESIALTANFDRVRSASGGISQTVNVTDNLLGSVLFDGRLDEDVQFDGVVVGTQSAFGSIAEQYSASSTVSGQQEDFALFPSGISANATQSSLYTAISFVNEVVRVSGDQNGGLPFFAPVTDGVGCYDLAISTGAQGSVVEDRVEFTAPVTSAFTASGVSANSVSLSNAQSMVGSLGAISTNAIQTSAVIGASSVDFVYVDADSQMDAPTMGMLSVSRQVSESAQFVDASNFSLTQSALSSEVLGLSSVLSTQPIFAADIDEAAQFNDAQSVLANFVSVQNESVRLNGVVNTAAIQFVDVQEQATLYDATLRRNLWELIDDAQNANWQNINTV
jgi:hypothetical protein